MTQPQPCVSVVIPVYNGAAFLAEAIDSVLAQTHGAVELIVVDDGSTDGGATAAIAAAFGDRIRYFWQPNAGVAAALNRGIAEMRGEAFSWLSHDDLYKPEKIAVQVAAWQRFGRTCVVCGDYEIIDETGAPQGVVSAGDCDLLARPLDGVYTGVLNGCAMLIPREVFERVGTFATGLPVTQDYELWFRMARAVPFVRSPGVLVSYRSHPAQGSRRRSHADQTSRLFAHLVDQTTDAEMAAYDGSPLRFLLRVKRHWQALDGLADFLSGRAAPLLEHEAVAAVLFAPGAASFRTATDALLAARPRPHAVVHIAFRPAVPLDGAEWATLVEQAAVAASQPVLAFHAAEDGGAPALLRAGLEELVRSGAAVVRPGDHARRLSLLDGLVMRRAAVPAVCAALRAGDLALSGLAGGDYTPPAGAGAAVAAALRGIGASRFDRMDRHDAVAVTRTLLGGTLPVVLVVGSFGNPDRAVDARALAAAVAGRAACLFLQSQGGGHVTLSAVPCEDGRGLRFDLPARFDGLVEVLREVGVVRADVRDAAGFEDVVEALLDALGVPYDVTLADYGLVAGDRNLCDRDGRYVGPGGGMARALLPRLLRTAGRVIAGSHALAQTVAAMHPHLAVHPAPPVPRPASRTRHVFVPRLDGGDRLRVAVVGPVGRREGRDVVLAVARTVRDRGLPVQIHVLGDLVIPAAEWRAYGDALVPHGTVEDDHLGETLIGLAPHLAWCPVQAPEVGLHALDRIQDFSYPLAASAIGSLPERCAGRAATWLLPWDSPADAWISLFLTLHASGLRDPPARVPPAAPGFYPDAYLEPVTGGRPTRPGQSDPAPSFSRA
ncbi:glycosyltransferase [Azospirillum sp. ST 5-10]|uniref:glycosyltransferase n=1 Tax=unclassified Azospirillum TaxID=2630922 RepID=UPI003F4A5131